LNGDGNVGGSLAVSIAIVFSCLVVSAMQKEEKES
jgi:hypothetical protein